MLAFLVAETGAQKKEMLQKSSNAKLKLRRTRKTKKLRKSKVKRMIAKGRRSAQKWEAKSKKQKSSKAKLKLRRPRRTKIPRKSDVATRRPRSEKIASKNPGASAKGAPTAEIQTKKPEGWIRGGSIRWWPRRIVNPTRRSALRTSVRKRKAASTMRFSETSENSSILEIELRGRTNIFRTSRGRWLLSVTCWLSW